MPKIRRLTGRALSIGIAALTIALVACGGASEDGTASPPASDASATVSATESTLATATLDADSEATAIATEETGATSVAAEDCAPTTSGLPSNGVTALVVNNDCLEPLFFAFDENGGDPFWHIHTQQDDTFISLELYTAYGPSWTGETGAFPLDCNVPWGLCLLFDPDGAGPEPVLMWGNGEITIDRLDEGGYDVTFGGTMPATADGTIYEITSTRWSSS